MGKLRTLLYKKENEILAHLLKMRKVSETLLEAFGESKYDDEIIKRMQSIGNNIRTKKYIIKAESVCLDGNWQRLLIPYPEFTHDNNWIVIQDVGTNKITYPNDETLKDIVREIKNGFESYN